MPGSLRSTSSNAARAGRTRRGKDMTAVARTTALGVKRTSMPARSSRPPSVPRRCEGFQQQNPDRRGRQDQGQGEESLGEHPQRPAAPRQQPPGPDAERQDEESRERPRPRPSGAVSRSRRRSRRQGFDRDQESAFLEDRPARGGVEERHELRRLCRVLRRGDGRDGIDDGRTVRHGVNDLGRPSRRRRPSGRRSRRERRRRRRRRAPRGRRASE